MNALQTTGDKQVLVDYMSAHSASVSAVRAMTMQEVFAKLKELGHFADYSAHYPEEHARAVTQALAASWLPVAVLTKHYETLDAMGLSDAQIMRFAEELGAGLFDQLFATIVRAVRKAGAGPGIWFGFKQADRVMARIYDGGGCTVVQVGPKDALYEIRGLPGANTRASQLVHVGFVRGVLSITVKCCVVKVVPASQRRPDYLRLAVSWV